MRASGLFLPTLVITGFLAAIGLTASPVVAQNAPPPSGAILDLSGTPIPHSRPQDYSVEFQGPATGLTAISFAFRDDPGFIQFSDVSLVDLTTKSVSPVNLLSNGNFSQSRFDVGLGSSIPVGWTFSNLSGIGYNGSVISSCAGSSYCWSDGTVQGYDELSQSVWTLQGDEYALSFSAMEEGGFANWSSVSTNGGGFSSGNASDILAYVAGIDGPYPSDPSGGGSGGGGSGGGGSGGGGSGGSHTTLPVPELSTWAMMLVGFLGLSVAGYRRAQRTPSA